MFDLVLLFVISSAFFAALTLAGRAVNRRLTHRPCPEQLAGVTCILPAAHDGHHRTASGTTWGRSDDGSWWIEPSPIHSRIVVCGEGDS